MTDIVIDPTTDDILVYVNEGIPGSVTTDGIQTLTNKTLSYDNNTFVGVQEELESGTNIKTINGVTLLGSGDIEVLTTNLNDEALTNIKTISFSSEIVINSTSGSITVDWTVGQNYVQNEPTGGISYTFTNPPGPCHLQLRVISDGTSTAQAFVWPSNVNWLLFTWEALDNKGAIINFWFDGTDYWAMGSNEV